MMHPFVAIDFETANEQRRSACSVGLVKFDAFGRATERFSTLLQPHPEVNYFNPVNTWVHGIRADDVAGAPQWSQVAGEVARFLGDLPIVAHNMAFDGYVLSDLAGLYGLEPQANRRFCTLRLARRVLASELERKGLEEVFDYFFPGETFAHHDATADAQAAGQIFARMQEEYGYEQLAELCPPTGARRRTASPGSRGAQLEAQELIAHYGNSEAIRGQRIAITGTLSHGQRAAVQELLVSLGATPEKSLTKKTTMLVVGIPNPQAWSEGSSASRKLDKAAKLREAGSRIEVITEEEFFQRLVD